MAQVIIRNLDEEIVRRLKERARRQGHSLEGELREILAAAARQDMAALRERAAAMRTRYEGTHRPTARFCCAKTVIDERRRRCQRRHQMVPA